MINSITVTNPLDESLQIDLRNPSISGFQVRSIDGLGPSKATINTTEVLSIDGALFNSARLASRNIILDLGLTEFPTIELMRQKSYRFFPIKQLVNLLIETDTRSGVIQGYVESNEVNIFGKDPERCVISIVCPNPYFYSTVINSVLFSGVSPSFKFPFSNESLVAKLINFGTIYNNQEQSVYYTGDAEVGVTVYLHATGGVVNPIIYNSRTLQSMTIDTTKLAALTGSGIIAGDDIIITTTRGNKSVTLIRSGIEYNILNTIDKNATWFTLFYGDNLFRYSASAGVANVQLRVENLTLFEGL